MHRAMLGDNLLVWELGFYACLEGHRGTKCGCPVCICLLGEVTRGRLRHGTTGSVPTELRRIG